MSEHAEIRRTEGENEEVRSEASTAGRPPSESSAGLGVSSNGSNWRCVLLGVGAAASLIIVVWWAASNLGFIKAPGPLKMVFGPTYETVGLTSEDEWRQATITYPTQMDVGDYADITIEIENRGFSDWMYSDERARDRSPFVMFESHSTFGTDHYLKGLSVVSMEPLGYHNEFEPDGSYAYISLGPLESKESATLRMRVMATLPGAFRAVVRAGGGTSSQAGSDFVEFEIQTVVNPK